MELFTLASSTALVASVGEAVQSTSGGMYPIIAIVIGLPLTFWAIYKLRGLFSLGGRR